MYSALILQYAPRVPAIETAVDASRPVIRLRLRWQLAGRGRRLFAQWMLR